MTAAPPAWLADQHAAAEAEATALLARVPHVAAVLEPHRWTGAETLHEPATPDEAAELRTIVATVVAREALAVCGHLRTGGPQPALVRLALHRADCLRCARTIRRPPPDEADRCDWCGRRGVAVFTTRWLQHGALIVAGDACANCRLGAPAHTEAPT